MKKSSVIGVISDTHGLLRPEAVKALQKAEMILHAGDIGKKEVLDQLRDIAPTIAIRGNTDSDEWAEALSSTEVVRVGEATLYMLHDLARLDLDPVAAGFHCVISGHSHKPTVETWNNVVYLNPGAAGPKRFKLPVSVALLHVSGQSVEAQIVELSCV